MTTLIGKWIHRPGLATWHQVESEITDRLVTHCGREMKLRTSRGDLELADVPLLSRGRPCEACWGTS